MTKVTIIENGSPDQMTRKQRGAHREAYIAAARHWWFRLLPRHFTMAGAIEYGYEPRKPTYIARKMRSKHHRDPLVWSGHSRQTALRGDPRVVATYKGASVKVEIPRFWNYKPGLRNELLAASGRDETALDKIIETVVMRELNKPERRRVRSKR